MKHDTSVEENTPQERNPAKKTWHQPRITEIGSLQSRTQSGLIGNKESPPVYTTS